MVILNNDYETKAERLKKTKKTIFPTFILLEVHLIMI